MRGGILACEGHVFRKKNREAKKVVTMCKIMFPRNSRGVSTVLLRRLKNITVIISTRTNKKIQIRTLP